MKLLIVHNRYQHPGGEDIVVAQEKQLLADHGHRVTVYERSNYELEHLTFRQQLGLPGRIVSASDSKHAVGELLRDLKPDLVHVHNTFAMISPSVYAACREADLPVVQTLHNYRLVCPATTLYRAGKVCEACTTHGLLSSVWHRCYRNSPAMSGTIALMLKTHRMRKTWSNRIDAYIALSPFSREKFLGSGIPAHKLHVKPNFVEPDPGERSSPGEYALYVGRLTQEKGVGTLLDAWNRLPYKVPLILAGDGPMRSQVEKKVSADSMQRIKYVGRLQRAEIYDAMKRAAFLIVPSLWYEPFGLVVAEAFACGTPVLVSSTGALQDMVKHDVTGLHFAPGNADALSDAVSWAWAHLRQMAVMGKACRKAYLEKYTGKSNYQQLMNIYGAAIETHFRSRSKRPLRFAA